METNNKMNGIKRFIISNVIVITIVDMLGYTITVMRGIKWDKKYYLK